MATDTSTTRGDISRAATSADFTSLVNQVAHLQEDREKLMKEIETYKSTMGRLQQGKREEMRQVFDNVISKWLSDSVTDTSVREKFQEGVKRMVEDTNECGVWTVACEASKHHARQLDEMEKLRSEINTLRSSAGDKAAAGGTFSGENSRKRTLESTENAGSSAFWGNLKLELD